MHHALLKKQIVKSYICNHTINNTNVSAYFVYWQLQNRLQSCNIPNTIACTFHHWYHIEFFSFNTYFLYTNFRWCNLKNAMFDQSFTYKCLGLKMYFLTNTTKTLKGQTYNPIYLFYKCKLFNKKANKCLNPLK